VVIARLVARLRFPLLVVPVLVAGAAFPSSATVTQAATTKAANACALLTRAEIESVLSGAPLDPGPTKRVIPNSRTNFTDCRWDDEREATSVQLAVFTKLGRRIKSSQLGGLGRAAAGTAARDLTAEELTGLGDRGTVEIVRDGTYGNIGIVKGRDAYLVSAAYQGPGAPQVTEADMLALARLAAARV
jgi:hypothetical protein